VQPVPLHCLQVNKIREIPQHPHLIVTHTDSKETYLWNADKQPHRPRDKVGTDSEGGWVGWGETAYATCGMQNSSRTCDKVGQSESPNRSAGARGVLTVKEMLLPTRDSYRHLQL
jgi:hypothetical protein